MIYNQLLPYDATFFKLPRGVATKWFLYAGSIDITNKTKLYAPFFYHHPRKTVRIRIWVRMHIRFVNLELFICKISTFLATPEYQEHQA